MKKLLFFATLVLLLTVLAVKCSMSDEDDVSPYQSLINYTNERTYPRYLAAVLGVFCIAVFVTCAVTFSYKLYYLGTLCILLCIVCLCAAVHLKARSASSIN